MRREEGRVTICRKRWTLIFTFTAVVALTCSKTSWIGYDAESVTLRKESLGRMDGSQSNTSLEDGFPRNPTFGDCDVEYSQRTMFCVHTSLPFRDLYADLVKRLLEYHFQCHTGSFQVFRKERDATHCLWIGVSNATFSPTWPNSRNSSFLLISLLPELYQDYHWMPTMHTTEKQTCLILSSGESNSGYFTKVKNLFISMPWRDFLAEFCRCDLIVTNGIPEIEYLAVAFGVPFVASRLDSSFMSLNQNLSLTDVIFPENISLSDTRYQISVSDVTASFPSHLVRLVPRPKFFGEHQRPQTLVIILGSLRGGELAWSTLYRNVLDINNADLALCIGADQSSNSSLYSRAQYLWEYPEYDDWADAIDMIHDRSWRTTNNITSYVGSSGTLGGVKGLQGSGAIIFMARWFAAQNIKRLRLTHKYDRFVVTRSDHYYACRHDLKLLDPRFMWVPTGEDYYGITDRHLVCNAGQILPALDIFPPVIKFPEKYLCDSFIQMNPESLIKLRWQEENLWKWVKRFDRVMFTCATEGDKTRWKWPAPEKSVEGVYQKYEHEYISAHCNCKGGPGSVLVNNATSRISTCFKQADDSSSAVFSLWFNGRIWKPIPVTNSSK